ncbi:sensor domain-containing diguanylate cyclase [Kordiimonas sp. SCSIO 12603]|uniref:sensor domain-containing diguanylate cyclase n=1 Tax=Kordiimonas sp. SCSIO 12603 TaxID=2829596 RepID=UPI0021023324|nr:sensor domain-containing diguanylate cyclase [Kordiimonas sp. SCSIO 12603]UTW58522.1 sensor domain-containing diguanylate cyclase [Kordiimonas sp. SCSIO 12603]
MNLFKSLGRSKLVLDESDICAIYVDKRKALVAQSDTSESLVSLWEEGYPAFLDAYEQVSASQEPQEFRLADERHIKCWIVVTPYEGGAFFVARETTLADQMTEALIESRAMLKGLLDSAVDFSFEVDPLGRFKFVSPAVAFGEKTESWIGKDAHSVFWPKDNAPGRSPFTQQVQKHMDGVSTEIAGIKRYASFAVEPVIDEEGKIVAVRGSCRDVTERIEAERKTRLDNLRLSVQQRITQILNSTENSQDLLDNASKELIQVMRADLVWSVLKKYKEGLVPASICGDLDEELDLDSIWESLSGADSGVHEINIDSRGHLVIQLESAGEDVGMVIISRDTTISPWSDLEKELLADIADVLTAAFGKAKLIDRLYRLSSKDELTDLLNRRAMREGVEARLKHQSRTKQAGCMVFIDLDHFKEVNDTLGHNAGDDAIRLVAEKMQSIIRPCDLAGRMGGDEFVLWIEDVDEETAAVKARELIDYMPSIREKIKGAHLRLGASIGICKSVPDVDLAFDVLAARADAALYDVKKTGKNDIAFAGAPEEA